MDLLQVAKQINDELTQLQLRYNYLLDEQETMAIFDSVVTCITDDLADSITLSINRDPQHILKSWKYDLHDQRYPERVGPKLREILEWLKQVPPGTAYLACEPQWSPRFLSIDKLAQQRILQDTIWSKNFAGLQEEPTRIYKPKANSSNAIEKPKPKSSVSVQTVDIRPLEYDLLKLTSETRIIVKDDVSAISESVKKCIGADRIQGVLLLILGDDRNHPLLEWKFEVTPDLNLARYGVSLEQVLAIVKNVKGHPQLDVRPISSPDFKQLSPEEQQEAMKDTIWNPAAQKKGWFS